MAELSYFIGVLGALILALAWLTSLIRTLRSKKNTIDPTFTTIYFIASVLLTIYSALIGDMIFAIINGLASLIALIELVSFFSFRSPPKAKQF